MKQALLTLLVVLGLAGFARALAPLLPVTGQGTATASAAAVGTATGRRSLVVRNLDASATLYCGPSTVTTANGLPIRAGEAYQWDTCDQYDRCVASTVVECITSSGSISYAIGEARE